VTTSTEHVFDYLVGEVARLADGVPEGDESAYVTTSNPDDYWHADVVRRVRTYEGTEYLVVIARLE
jgi:hypothetical protein